MVRLYAKIVEKVIINCSEKFATKCKMSQIGTSSIINDNKDV